MCHHIKLSGNHENIAQILQFSGLSKTVVVVIVGIFLKLKILQWAYKILWKSAKMLKKFNGFQNNNCLPRY